MGRKTISRETEWTDPKACSNVNGPGAVSKICNKGGTH